MVRLFYAVEIDEEIKKALRPALDPIRKLGNHVRVAGSGGMHLTLLFLGEQPEDVVPDFVQIGRDAVEMARPCSVAIGPPGYFPRVSYLTLTGEIETLGMIASMLNETCSGYLEKQETRPFKAHLTLARHKKNISGQEKEKIGKEFSGFEGRSWIIDELVLFKSDLTPKGAIYTVLGKFKFGG
jgi:2'-5' RNA ligase